LLFYYFFLSLTHSFSLLGHEGFFFLFFSSLDGIRMAWNVIPGTKQEASNCVVPVSAIYTPNKPFPNMPVLPYSALRCRTCRSILNPFSIVDFAAKIWICPFCFQLESN
jgi:protein transport protein SEC23